MVRNTEKRAKGEKHIVRPGIWQETVNNMKYE
jgi:hypothetical protein